MDTNSGVEYSVFEYEHVRVESVRLVVGKPIDSTILPRRVKPKDLL